MRFSSVLSLLPVLAAVSASTSPLANQLPPHIAAVFRRAEETADPASFSCHLDCGYAILAARKCTLNTEDEDAGPYDNACLCAEGTQFARLMAKCSDCGWCLYDNYWPGLSNPIVECALPPTPTGSVCSPTSSYTLYVSASYEVAAVAVGTTSAVSSGNATIVASRNSTAVATGIASGSGSVTLAPTDASAVSSARSSASSAASSGRASASSDRASASSQASSSASSTAVNGAKLLGPLFSSGFAFAVAALVL